MPRQTSYRPKRPFMIMAVDETGNDMLRVTPKGCKWVDWDGSKYATREEAQAEIDRLNLLRPAKVVEIIEETRFTTR